MNTQLMVREEANFDVMLRDVENMQKVCSSLMKTKHYQSMGEAGIFAIVQKAKSLNINPLEALNGGLYYVQGKVGMSSEMMASLIRQSGHSIIKDPKSDNSVCILHGKRADNGDTWTITFSMEDAKRAGLAKNMYDKYPAIMLYNRAMSMLARQLFPDVIKGAGYTHEELMEVKERPTVVVAQQEAVMEALLSEEEASALEDAFDLVPEYKAQVLKFLTASYKITSFKDLPLSLVDRIKAGLQKKLAECEAQEEPLAVEA